jgi:hypothetical protein
MGLTLQKSKNTLHITLFFLFVFGLQSMAIAQIPLQQLQPFEVSFHPENQRNGQNFVRLNISNQSEWQDYIRIPVSEETERIRVDQTDASVYMSSPEGEWALIFDLNKIDSDNIFTATYSNETGHFISNLRVSIDLIAFDSPDSKKANLSAYYRFNENDLIPISGSNLDLNTIPVPENGTTSLSMQFKLDQIYFSASDEFSVVLIRDRETDVITSPLGIKRIELTPGTDDPDDSMDIVSLMITEIMPRYVQDGIVTEYIEIYNPNSESVDLKGYLLNTSDGKHAISEHLIIDPFSFVVLANFELPDNSPVHADYRYKNLSLPAHGSVISLRYRDSEIIRAFYDANTPGTAWELRNPSEAFDGYAGMQQFIPSDNSLDETIKGSPGSQGNTDLYFINDLRSSVWQLVSIPGVLSERPRDAGQAVEFHTLSANSYTGLRSTDVNPHTPYLARTGTVSSRLLAMEIPTDRVQVYHTGSYSVIPNPSSDEIELNQFRTPDNNIISRSALLWDPVNSTFTFSDLHDHIIPAWTSVLIPSKDIKTVNLTDSSVSQNDYKESRFINLKLTGVNSSRETLRDESVMIYFSGTEADRNQANNFKKLWPLNITENEKASLIYLSSQNGALNNLFASGNYSLNPSREIKIDLGLINYQFEGTFTLNWSSMENIPDEWELLLIDNKTGETINMQERNSYQFQENRTSFDESVVPQVPGIHTLNVADENPRFTLRILSSEAVRNDQRRVSDIPETVELYQNYPNPFNPATNISFYLPEQRMATVSIYNVVGQRVGILLQDNLAAGEHTLVWDASDMPSGIYIIHLEIGNRVYTRKMTLIK